MDSTTPGAGGQPASRPSLFIPAKGPHGFYGGARVDERWIPASPREFVEVSYELTDEPDTVIVHTRIGDSLVSYTRTFVDMPHEHPFRVHAIAMRAITETAHALREHARNLGLTNGDAD